MYPGLQQTSSGITQFFELELRRVHEVPKLQEREECEVQSQDPKLQDVAAGNGQQADQSLGIGASTPQEPGRQRRVQ